MGNPSYRTGLDRSSAGIERVDPTGISQETDPRLLAIIEALPAAIYSTDIDGRILFYNQAAADLWGYRPEPGQSQWCGAWKLYHKDGSPMPHAECPMAVTLREKRPVRGVEAIMERPDGTRIPFAPFPSPLFDDSGNLIGAVNMLIDCTERMRSDEVLNKRANEQAALYRFTDRLYRAECLEDIYESALDAIVHALGCNRASILLLDGQGVMRFVAWRGLSDGYRKAVEGHSPWSRDEENPQPVCIGSVEFSDISFSLKSTVVREGVHALIFIPLMANGKLIGKFMAYYEQSHSFTENEVDLSLVISRQLGFSIDRMRAEDERRRVSDMLRESVEREKARAAELQAIMEAVPAAIMISRDAECRQISGNRAAYEWLRVPPHANLSLSAAEDERPKNFEVMVNGQVLMPEALPVQRAAHGEEIYDYEEEIRYDDGTSLYLLGNAKPLRDELGTPCGAVAAFIDITERKKAEIIRNRLISIIDCSTDAIISKDLNGIIQSWNGSAARLFGYSAAEAVGKSITMLMPSTYQNEEARILERIRRGESIEHYETVRRRKDGSLIDISLTISPIKDADGRVIGASKIARDISERKKNEAQKNLFIHEMNHRIKNLFAVTSSLVSLSAHAAQTSGEMVESIRNRLSALMRAHELTCSDMVHPGSDLRYNTTLHSLIRAIFRPYMNSGGGDHVVITGLDMPVGAHAITNFALVLHELATNAAKYGPLQSSGGCVHIDSSVSGHELILVWREEGGPELTEPMGNEGFGGFLVRRIVMDQFGGRISTGWMRSGIVLRIALRTDKVS